MEMVSACDCNWLDLFSLCCLNGVTLAPGSFLSDVFLVDFYQMCFSLISWPIVTKCLCFRIQTNKMSFECLLNDFYEYMYY